MTIAKPFIPVANPVFDEDEKTFLLECIETGWISSKGHFVKDFEEKFAATVDTKFALATSSGTTALSAALIGLDIRPGDKVIIPNYTFHATATAIIFAGAIPIVVDVDPSSWAINAFKIQDLIERQKSIEKSKIKAIMPVAISGFPWDLQAIEFLAKTYNLKIIGDNCQALGTLMQDKFSQISLAKACDAAAYSFFANKIITTGEGGIMTTSNKETYKRAKAFINQGIFEEDSNLFIAKILGFNARMTNLQAAIGFAQLDKLEPLLEQKQIVSAWYEKYLTSATIIQNRENSDLNIPAMFTQSEHEQLGGSSIRISRWMFRLAFSDIISIQDINKTRTALREQGYETKPLYPPISQQPFIKELVKEGRVILDRDLSFSESLKGFYLPTHGEITEKQVEEMSSIIKKHLHFS